jgi:hypothetical protein
MYWQSSSNDAQKYKIFMNWLLPNPQAATLARG